MIIDLILDRRGGVTYNAKEFYNDILQYEQVFDFDISISGALDYGNEEQVKESLRAYIDQNDYNPDIKNYINSVEWLSDDDV